MGRRESQTNRKKTAPGIPGTLLGKHYELSQKPTGLLPEALELLAVALTQHLQRTGEVQTDHADKTFGVEHLHAVADENPKGLHGGHGDELPNLRKGANCDLKFLHNYPLPLYKDEKIVYNKTKVFVRGEYATIIEIFFVEIN